MAGARTYTAGTTTFGSLVMNRPLRRVAAIAAASVLTLAAAAAPMQLTAAAAGTGGDECFDPAESGASARGTSARDADHRDVSRAEQRAIEKRTAQILAGRPGGTGASIASIPVHVHVMIGKGGVGNVTDAQIANQIDVLNATYSGTDPDGDGPDTGVGFTLAGTERIVNDAWHHDRKSTTYRAQTRDGGADALNIWLVDFKWLGIATFPWDYSSQSAIDGIRVNYRSLPGGSIANYNLGETATHEAGHWLGLYHTFQGGCNEPNDEVLDTPAQAGPTTGCPIGRDSCTSAGLDPIHNYMDYSYDRCYYEFTPGQTARMNQMWTAYRG